jgi:hypothetical protein
MMSGMTERSNPAPDTSTVVVTAAGRPPVIVDLGKQRRKRIKQLRRGEGKLVAEVTGAVEELRASGTIAADAQAVVFVVRERRRGLKSLIPRL